MFLLMKNNIKLRVAFKAFWFGKDVFDLINIYHKNEP